MNDPMFVSIQGDFWVNVEHITYVRPFVKMEAGEGKFVTEVGVAGLPDPVYADTPTRDFLNRMTGVIWK